MKNLTRFLTGYINKPFAPGACCLWLADWWKANHGIDPAKALRGQLCSDSDKDRVVHEAGGVADLVAGIAASVSAALTDDPARGDFGVVRNGALQVGAIYSGGDMWAVRSEKGVMFLRSPVVVRAWRI